MIKTKLVLIHFKKGKEIKEDGGNQDNESY